MPGVDGVGVLHLEDEAAGDGVVLPPLPLRPAGDLLLYHPTHPVTPHPLLPAGEGKGYNHKLQPLF